MELTGKNGEYAGFILGKLKENGGWISRDDILGCLHEEYDYAVWRQLYWGCLDYLSQDKAIEDNDVGKQCQQEYQLYPGVSFQMSQSANNFFFHAAKITISIHI